MLPAGDISLDNFGSLADAFKRECEALINKVADHWIAACMARIEEHALQLEKFIQ